MGSRSIQNISLVRIQRKNILLQQTGFLQGQEGASTALRWGEKAAAVAPSQTRTFQPPCQGSQANRNIHTQVTGTSESRGLPTAGPLPKRVLLMKEATMTGDPALTAGCRVYIFLETSPPHLNCLVRNRGLESWQMDRKEWAWAAINTHTHTASKEGTNGFQEKQLWLFLKDLGEKQNQNTV